jgi:hypothetical protein
MKGIYSTFQFPLDLLQMKLYSLNGCFCKILLDLTLGNYKTYSVQYFWVKPILGDQVLLVLATDHRIIFFELLWFSGRFISESIVIFTTKCIVFCLLIRKLQIQFCWVCIVVSYLMLCWMTCFDQVDACMMFGLSIGLFTTRNCFPY